MTQGKQPCYLNASFLRIVKSTVHEKNPFS
jgi:hypothetical protein